MTPSARPTELSTDSLRESPPRSASCLNCGTPLSGQFCSHCGQRDVPPYPSVRELVVDAFWELSGWDGRFATTVRALLRKPGMLTREFLEGRRARYISPLRLYLMTSLVYFLVSAAAPDNSTHESKHGGFGLVTTSDSSGASRPLAVGNAAGNAMRNQQPISAAERDSILTAIGKAPPVMQPFLRRAVTDPTGFKKGLLESMPRMLFALLPVFAGIVAVFYRGRKYPEHLYFAIHLHAFVFLALTIAALSKFPRVNPLSMTVRLAVFAWIPIYATLAFRRAYGGSAVRTLVKEAGIGVIYAVVSLVAFVVTLYWVARFA